MGLIQSVVDLDVHYRIDPISRIIETSSKKVTIMQHDHKSERFTFEVPRFVEGHDMSLCNKIEVHYINTSSANKNEHSKDVYLVDDVQISPEDENVVIFSWLISCNATKYAGTLNFLIRFACLTASTIDYAWHTDIHKGISVGKGMYNGEAVVENNSDALGAALDGVESATVRATEAADKVEFLLAEIEPSLVQINEGGIE